MKISFDLIKQSLIRFMMITGLIIAVGYLIYQESVFISTRWTFQFFISGITLGITYAMFKANHFREGFAILCLGYIAATCLISSPHSWLFILEGIYISFIAVAVYIYLIISRIYFNSTSLIRIIISGVLIGIVNSLIIIVLNLFPQKSSFDNTPIIMEYILLNLKIGVGIGLLFGIGVELSNWSIKSCLIPKELPDNEQLKAITSLPTADKFDAV
jgi:hypothetical protein